MDKQLIFDMIGYTGSFLVVISMLMTSVIKLRVINTIGAVIFLCYAICTRSIPTAVMQLSLIIINVINLYKLIKKNKQTTSATGDSNE